MKNEWNNFSDCKDIYTFCPGSALTGDCEKGQYQTYMKNNCPESCGLCGSGGEGNNYM